MMGETLYDENIGGPFGNTHLAIWSAYKESYRGDVASVSPDQRNERWFNDSVIHTDIVSTTNRMVTATLTDGSSLVIYRDGQFCDTF
jgi:aminopeptidase